MEDHSKDRSKDDLYSPTNNQWMQFMRQMIVDRSVGVLDFEKCSDIIAVRVREWMVAKQCIRMSGKSPIERWEVLWTLAVLNRKAATEYGDRMDLYMETVDVYDANQRYKNFAERSKIEEFVKKWIHVFLEFEVVRDTKHRVIQESLHEVVRRWLGMCLPEAFLKHLPMVQLSLACIATSQWKSVKMSHRRVIDDANYRDMTMLEELMRGFQNVLVEEKPSRGRRVKLEEATAPASSVKPTPVHPATPATPATPTSPPSNSTALAIAASDSTAIHLGSF